jgi:hypothetical protein
MDKLTNEEIEYARKAIEDVLIEYRDARFSLLCNTGLVCKEKDGSSSSHIRLTIRESISIAINAINEFRRLNGTLGD